MVDIISQVEHLGLCGYTLPLSERAGLQVSMSQRQLEEDLGQKLLFWGKILADDADYLVCYSSRTPSYEEGLFQVRQYYYATSNDFTLRQLPVLSTEQELFASSILKTQRFKGDPSFPLDADPVEEQEEASEDDAEVIPKPERFRELHRLAYTVGRIDHDAALVPKGALVVESSRRVSANRQYSGLSYEAAGNKKNYFHYRPPESIKAKSVLYSKGFPSASEFLDSLTADQPDSVWSIAFDSSNTMITLRNFSWPGYVFFSQVDSANFGGVYFGTGLPNTDISFML